MKIPAVIQRIFNRSILLYAVVAAVLMCCIDRAHAVKERRRYLLGIFYNQDFKNYKDGVVYFDYWTHQRTNDERNYFLLGYCYLYLNDYDRAVRYFTRAVELAPDNGLYAQYREHAASKLNKDARNVPLPIETIPIPLDDL